MIRLRLILIISGHLLAPTGGLVTTMSQLFCLNPGVQRDQILPSVDVFESFPVKSLAECAFRCLQRPQKCVAFNTRHPGTGILDTQECQLGKNISTGENGITFDQSFKYYEICSLDSTTKVIVTSGGDSIAGRTSMTTQLLSTTSIYSPSGNPTTTVTSPVTIESSTFPITKESSTSPVTKESSTFPVTKESSTFPVIKESSTSPVTNESSTSPVTKESSTSLVTKESSTFPVTKESSTFPVTKESSTFPVTKESSTSPVTKESSTTTVGHFANSSTQYPSARVPTTTMVSTTKTTRKVINNQLGGVDAAATMYFKVPEEDSDWKITYLLFSTNKIYVYRDPTFNVQPYILRWADIAPSGIPEPLGVKAIITSGSNYHMSVLMKDDKIVRLRSKYEGGFENDIDYAPEPSSECVLTFDVQAAIDHDDDLSTCIYIKQSADKQTVYAKGYNVESLRQVIQNIINNNPDFPITASITIGPINSIEKILIFMGMRYITIERSDQIWIETGSDSVPDLINMT